MVVSSYKQITLQTLMLCRLLELLHVMCFVWIRVTTREHPQSPKCHHYIRIELPLPPSTTLLMADNLYSQQKAIKWRPH
ncbi:hypothetical protein J6590_046516 [Homalodisca vitripennis]|nr:hypothetical protein J6590_046516 [Homalodisca vitripennis]